MKSKKIKQELRSKIENTLKVTFPELPGEIKPKKFDKNIRKASKALLAGLKINHSEKTKTKSGKLDQVSLLVDQPQDSAAK